MNREFYVQFDSNDLLDDIPIIKKKIIDRFDVDYKTAVDNAKEREKRNFLYKLWYENLWDRCCYIMSSFEIKMKKCYDLEEAALAGKFVYVDSETLKWIRKHFYGNWVW